MAMNLDKKSLSEQDICLQFITPSITQAGWLPEQIGREVQLTDGQVLVKGQTAVRSTGSSKRADYILYYKPDLPLAVVEAKSNIHSVSHGIQQAKGYAQMVDIPFVYSSNGDAFHQFDPQSNPVEQQITLDRFPSPDELWQRYQQQLSASQQQIALQSRYPSTEKTPRYYQQVAINRSLQAIARGQNRLLLVMATGTGKTYVASQIIWRLWKSGQKKRILFLADRNILVDQAKNNDFKYFGGAMTKISNRQIDKAYEIYLSLYQAISGNEEERNIYRQFSPGFFDLVVVDECHRGSAKEDAAWREILDYFHSATHLGLTATPKQDKEVSNLDYFGQPVYTYTLKQGIEDGFLAPYKVIRTDLDKDLDGWRPKPGQLDDKGLKIEDRTYDRNDMDRVLILSQRTQLVAKQLTEHLQSTDPMQKTIIFCEDIDHAERMRVALVNLNPEQVQHNANYVARITGDQTEGKLLLDNFIDPENPYPVIATTSRLLDTGVDAQTCKIIVLDQVVSSTARFKQIIGRGTRLKEEYGKLYFTIIDFRNITQLFADPDFDGLPVGDEDETDEDQKPERKKKLKPDTDDTEGRVKYHVAGVDVFVLAQRVQYYSLEGELITESLTDYTRQKVNQNYASLQDFLHRWTEEDRKEAVVQELEQQGVLFEALAEQVGRELDPFDLICHVVYDQPAMTRQERVNNIRRSSYFTEYGDLARQVLDALLNKYADGQLSDLSDLQVLNVSPFTQMGTALEILRAFGGRPNYQQAIKQLQQDLYKVA